MKSVIIGFLSGESEEMILNDKDIKKLKRCIRPGLFGRDKIAILSPLQRDQNTNSVVSTGEVLIVRRGAIAGISVMET